MAAPVASTRGWERAPPAALVKGGQAATEPRAPRPWPYRQVSPRRHARAPMLLRLGLSTMSGGGRRAHPVPTRAAAKASEGRRTHAASPKAAATAPVGRRTHAASPRAAATAPPGRRTRAASPRAVATAAVDRQTRVSSPTAVAVAATGRRTRAASPRAAPLASTDQRTHAASSKAASLASTNQRTRATSPRAAPLASTGRGTRAASSRAAPPASTDQRTHAASSRAASLASTDRLTHAASPRAAPLAPHRCPLRLRAPRSVCPTGWFQRRCGPGGSSTARRAGDPRGDAHPARRQARRRPGQVAPGGCRPETVDVARPPPTSPARWLEAPRALARAPRAAVEVAAAGCVRPSSARR